MIEMLSDIERELTDLAYRADDYWSPGIRDGLLAMARKVAVEIEKLKLAKAA